MLEHIGQSTHRQESQGQGLFGGFGNAFMHSLELPLDGYAQVSGEKRKDRFTVDANATGVEHLAQEAGSLAGTASLFMGGVAIARELPVLGKYASVPEWILSGVQKCAPVATGAALGFLTPIRPGEGRGARVANTLIGAGTMSIVEYGGGLFGKAAAGESFGTGLRRAALTNGTAGLFNVQADAKVHTGHFASLSDSALGVVSWAGMGMAFHTLGAPLRRSAAGNEVAQEAKPLRPLAGEPTTPTPLTGLMAGDHTIHVTSDGAIREYDLHVPAGYDSSKALPLMVILDGVSGNPKGNMARETQMNSLGDREQFAVAYPYARNGHKIPLAGDVYSWNSKNTGLTNYDPTYDDANLLDRVIADASKRLNIDSQRIYGVGFSEGGMMLHSYQATRPGTLAAIASVHGTVNGMEPVPVDADGNKIPSNVLVVLSTKDRMLPMGGGRGLMTMFMSKAKGSRPAMQAEFWNGVNDARPGVVQDQPFYTQTDWQSANGLNVVRQYVVKGGMHAWDGSPTGGWPFVGRPLKPEQFDLTPRVWQFLKNARLSRSLSDATESTRKLAAA